MGFVHLHRLLLSTMCSNPIAALNVHVCLLEHLPLHIC